MSAKTVTQVLRAPAVSEKWPEQKEAEEKDTQIPGKDDGAEVTGPSGDGDEEAVEAVDLSAVLEPPPNKRPRREVSAKPPTPTLTYYSFYREGLHGATRYDKAVDAERRLKLFFQALKMDTAAMGIKEVPTYDKLYTKVQAALPATLPNGYAAALAQAKRLFVVDTHYQRKMDAMRQNLKDNTRNVVDGMNSYGQSRVISSLSKTGI